jgi:L,D-peptidoglycan transpeptidase YkuD (ErfK/YbiS/YcfS/YnhG family)
MYGVKMILMQLVYVTARGSSAEIRCFEKDDTAGWFLVESLGFIPGFTGRNGVRLTKTEGDGCTPGGYYRLGHAFGVKEKPVTKMYFRRITGESFWVDDPGSSQYNTWVEGRDGADWNSAEQLSDYPREYAYAVVIEYNTAHRIPGKGSAVFLHCGNKPTSGCIAVPEPELLNILRWLDPLKSPGILITIA